MGGVIDFIQGGKESEAERAMQNARQVYADLDIPDIEKMKIYLQDLVLQGELDPEMAEAMLVGSSAFEDINSDPTLRAAQLDALRELQNIGSEGGLTPADRALLNRIASEEGQRERGSREAILMNAGERGVRGSGLELQAQLINAQEAADRRAQRDMDVAALAQKRALDAIMGSADLGGRIRGQDFEEQAAAAAAKDAIAKFNADAANQFQMFNTKTRNDAAAANLAAKQALANQNTAQKNAQEMHNKGLFQQNFENELAKKGGLAGAYQNQAQLATQQGQARQDLVGTLIQGGATAAAGSGGGAKSDERAKTDISEFNPEDFLDSITGFKYRFKNEAKDGSGSHAGVMAQDLEKTPEGAAIVSDTADGKMVDWGKGFGLLAASLANINERMKKGGL